jgi:nitrate reductase NapAB chaperone NapD
MLVGAVIRVEPGMDDAVRERLAHVEGVEPVEEATPGTIGIVIEANDSDGAHRVLTGEVGAIDGVLATWPVSAWYDDEPDAGGEPRETGERHAEFTA